MKKRILSLLLALALVLTGVPMAFATESGFADGNVPEISTDGPVQLPSSNIAEDPTVEPDAQQPVEAGEPKLVQNGEDRFSAQLAESEPKADEVVTFIVVMQKSPLLVAGFTKDDIATRAPKAVAYEAALRLELNALKANLTQKFRNDASPERPCCCTPRPTSALPMFWIISAAKRSFLPCAAMKTESGAWITRTWTAA